ncbi:hypothetical protein HK27_00200 [Acetobacter orientalis]|nr:hypothetical protein HK27_00200 [Acetobacter orientalis]
MCKKINHGSAHKKGKLESLSVIATRSVLVWFAAVKDVREMLFIVGVLLCGATERGGLSLSLLPACFFPRLPLSPF